MVPGFDRRRLPGMQRDGITDRSARGDVRERERLITKRKRGYVVPASEILRADNRAAAWSEHTPDFRHEMVETPHVLDYLVGMHNLERLVREGPAFVEVTTTNIEAPRTRNFRTGRNDLHGVNLFCRNAEPLA